MTNAFYLKGLEDYYNEMDWGEYPWSFTEFITNEYEKREELVENWDESNPDKASLSYYAGVILGYYH